MSSAIPYYLKRISNLLSVMTSIQCILVVLRFARLSVDWENFLLTLFPGFHTSALYCARLYILIYAV